MRTNNDTEGLTMRLSVRVKTMLGTAAIELVLLSALIWVALDFMLESANEALNKRATTTSQLFASATKDAVLSYDLASLETFATELLSNPDIRYVKVLDAEKQLLAFDGDESFMDTEFVADNDVSLVKDEVFDASAKIVESEVEFGTVYIGIDIGSINQALAKIKQFIVGIAVFEMILVAFFSYILGIYLTTNLYRLRDSTIRITESVQSGDYNFELETIRSKDELEQLSSAFTELSETLKTEHERKQAAEGDLIELNNELEQKVVRRTEKLQSQNVELEQINRALAETQEQLVQSEKMASVGQLAAGVAHEINNPIGFISSNVSTLKDYVDEYKQACNMVNSYLKETDQIKRNELRSELIEYFADSDFEFLNQDIEAIFQDSSNGLTRVAEIVGNLKQFSRADSTEMQNCDINECINTSLKMLNNETKYHCDIKTKLAKVPNVSANIGKITQVITNLLLNSSQAIDKDKKGMIRILTSATDDYVNIYINDTGKGIAEEVIDKIFDPFFTTKPVGEGTGLGLSICYDIIEEHGGSIRVNSSKTKGTTFSIALPIFQTRAVNA